MNAEQIHDRRALITRHRVDLALLESAIESHRMSCSIHFTWTAGEYGAEKYESSLRKIVDVANSMLASWDEIE